LPYLSADGGTKLYYEEVARALRFVFVHESAGDHVRGNCRCGISAGVTAALLTTRGYPPSDVPDDVERYSQHRAGDEPIRKSGAVTSKKIAASQKPEVPELIKVQVSVFLDSRNRRIVMSEPSQSGVMLRLELNCRRLTSRPRTRGAASGRNGYFVSSILLTRAATTRQPVIWRAKFACRLTGRRSVRGVWVK
jgi:hypothetical protein